MFDKNRFKNAPKDCSAVPFWFWNDAMDGKEIVFELKEMANQGIFEAIIHARKGLAVPYLSEEWFEKVGIALRIAKSLGMRLWIYDENNWPSGYADGRVIEKDPDFAAKCLSVEKIYPVLGKPVIVEEKPGSQIVAVSAVYQDKEFVDITSYGRNGKPAWHSTTLCWEVFVFRMENCLHCPAYSDAPYVDLLNGDATDAFIACTHAEYKRRFPEHWGNVIKGFFTDEPGFYQNYFEQAKNLNSIAWTGSFPKRFKEAYGYDILPYLPTLFQDMPASKRIRADYYSALSRFYRESYFDKIASFLHSDGLLSIGHLHREEKLAWLTQTEGDFFSAIDGLDYSGIDCIDKSYPRVTERLCGSASDLLNKPRAMCEIFGGFGWSLTPKEMKRFIDLQFVQGVNLIVPHALFSSIEGFRELESPPSLFYQNAYWPHFNILSDYMSRLSYALTQGKHRPSVAVYYPSLYAQKHFTPLDHRDVLDIDDCLVRLVGHLNKNGVDFTLVPEGFLSKAHIEGNHLKFCDFSFSALILPCDPDETILPIVKEFSSKGFVVSLNKTKGNDFASSSYFYYEEGDAVSELCSKVNRRVKGDSVIAYSRTLGDCELLFLVNVSSTEASASLFIQQGERVESLEAETGEIKPLFKEAESREETLHFLPNEAKLLCLSKDTHEPFLESKEMETERVPLHLKEALFNGKPYPYASAHQNGIHNFYGEICLSYSLYIKDKPKRVLVSFDDVRDFATVYVNNEESSTRLYPPFAFDVTPQMKAGENLITLKIANVKANEIEGADFDAGLLGNAEALIYND